MENQDFLREALAYDKCPANFEDEYNYFQKYQNMAKNMLLSFSYICKKNKVPYILSFGSMLGAIRDGGQIPWDYDVDVTVPYIYREQLYDALDRELDDKFYFCTPERDSNYRPSFVRIVPKGYMHQVVHVDVFFVIGLPDNREERSVYCQKVRETVLARKYVAEELSEYSYPIKTKLHYFLLKIKYLAKYGNASTGDHSDLYLKYDIRNAKEAGYISAKCGKIPDPVYRFLEPIEYETRDGVFYVPRDYEDYLSERYGDWKTVPSIEKRIAEVEKHCELFRWYEKKFK